MPGGSRATVSWFLVAASLILAGLLAYTLFMLGVFRERVERMASSGYYVTQGQRAYRFVSEHDRASTRPVRPTGGTLFGRLADRFEGYARALDYTRRVHFASGPSLSFLA